MKSKELKELRSETLGELEVIQKTAEAEDNRDLTEDENSKVDALLAKTDDYASKIERAEKVEKSLRESAQISGVVVEPKADKDLEKFTFQGAVRAAFEGNLSGIYKEMDQEARNEARYTGQSFRGVAIPASILTRAQDYVDTANQNRVTTMSFMDQLQGNLVLASAGANFYGGVENMKFPVISAITSEWQPETGGSEADGEGITSNVVLEPHKLISIVNISQESLVQNAGLEAAFQRNMAASIAAKLETALLSKADITNAPQSIFLDATASQTLVTIAAWVGLETDCLDAGVTTEGARLAYVGDTDSYKVWKSLAQIANVSPAYDNRDKSLNGIYAFSSGNVAADGSSDKAHCLYGDFSKVHIAQFGGLDLLFDPFTYGGIGIPRLLVTSLCDGDAVQNATFQKLIEA